MFALADYISIKEFLSDTHGLPVIDVRSPIEYKKGHIPEAINIPLFSNEERAVIGTAYKQESKEAAITLGLNFAEKRKVEYLAAIRQLPADNGLFMHCWRGGMRSAKFADFLTENSIKVKVVEGGYKAWRTEVHIEFIKIRNLLVIGGYTGTGKTELLHYLKKKGEQVIDLEDLANHRGSAFGLLPGATQPSTEQFENNLYQELKSTNANLPLYLEDESSFIGKIFIPHLFHQQMQNSTLVFLDVPQNIRAEKLAEDYGNLPKEFLWNSILRIKKRFGDERLKQTKEMLFNGLFKETAINCLAYYDKMYEKALNKKPIDKVFVVPCQQAEGTKLYDQLQLHLKQKKHV